MMFAACHALRPAAQLLHSFAVAAGGWFSPLVWNRVKLWLLCLCCCIFIF
jgi:hypothetical protein